MPSADMALSWQKLTLQSRLNCCRVALHRILACISRVSVPVSLASAWTSTSHHSRISLMAHAPPDGSCCLVLRPTADTILPWHVHLNFGAVITLISPRLCPWSFSPDDPAALLSSTHLSCACRLCQGGLEISQLLPSSRVTARMVPAARQRNGTDCKGLCS